MAIYSTAGVKGGSGRSTIAENLTIWLVKQGYDVLLVDADDQATVADFTVWRENTLNGVIGYTLVQLNGGNVRKQVEALKPKYDHIVIDTGGRDTTSQRAALFVADMVLVPIRPRSHDIWTLNKLIEMINEIQVTRAVPLIVHTFLNCADITSQENREAAEALASMPELGFVPHAIKNRKAYPVAGAKGLSVFEVEQPDLKAVAELEMLFNTIIHEQAITTTPAK